MASMGRSIAAFALALVTGAAAVGCGLQAPVLRYPWLEDESLALERQQLAVSIDAETVDVVARFDFRLVGPARDRGVIFPIPPACEDAESFRARLAGPEIEPEALEVWPADPGLLPEGEAHQAFEIVLPARALARHDGVLIVTYRQRCATLFRYALGAGAYWRGPIAQLDVMVRDRAGRVTEARVGDALPSVARGGRLRWLFEEVEPGGALEVGLRAVAAPTDSGTAHATPGEGTERP
jgi:hypothetical protein